MFFTFNRRSDEIPDEFDNNCQNVDLTLSILHNTSQFYLKVVEDFNAKCKKWWAADVNSNSGKELYSLTSTTGRTPLIDKPTFFFSGRFSCIYLV